MHSNMQLRIHSYSKNPDYHATFEYYRDSTWQDLTDRLVCQTSSGEFFPITVSRAYREIYTAKLTLNNEDGLLTPENQSSAYNINAALEYDQLLDEARKVRLAQGINCYALLTAGKTVTASSAPTAGTLDELVDGTYATYNATDLGSGYFPYPTGADKGFNVADTALVHWGSVSADAEVWVKIDLGTAQTVRHGAIQFYSKTSVSPEIMCPSTVQFAYSTDDSNWTNIGPAFDMSEYVNSNEGMPHLAYFTDANVSARYIRATITNISETNDIYMDEFVLYGGDSTAFQSEYTITGYLGDAIDLYANTGFIDVSFEDVRKKENDNRRVESTKEYKDQRPEQIIYDLLANPSYWSTVTVDENELVTNGGFEDAGTWTYGSGATRKDTKARTGSYCAELDWNGEYISQAAIPVTAEQDYILSMWYYAPPVAAAKWHVTLTFDVGGTIRFPDTGSYEFFCTTYQRMVWRFTAPIGASSVTFQLDKDTGGDGDWRVDDISLRLVTAEAQVPYDAPLDSTEVEWAPEDDLSAFVIPKWQGQQGSILDYCNELAALIGWVYDASGSGVRRFWQPTYNQITPDPYLSFWEDRMIGPEPVHRKKSGRDIRNALTLVGYEKGGKEVPRRYRHEASITRYGERSARINEPLIKSKEVSDQLAKALLRDFAYARDIVDSNIIGDFDIDRTKYIASFHEPIRAHVDNAELWSIEGYESEMITSGHGFYRGTLSSRRFVSAKPAPVTNITATGGSGSITVGWDANTEIDIDGYYVYITSNLNGYFTKRTKVTATSDVVSPLSNGTTYWMYVTAVNIAGVESEPSALIFCVAGGGNSGSEADSWGITDLAVTLTDSDPMVTADLSWTPAIGYTPDYIVLQVVGPETNNAPTHVSTILKATPVNAVLEHIYVNYVKADIPATYTYYWKVAVVEVVINDRHFKLGTPLLSNAPSAVWPG